MGEAPAPGPDRFDSLDELRDRHDSLLKSSASRRSDPNFAEEIRSFVEKARRTGQSLAWREDRALARSILNFWATRLAPEFRRETSIELDEHVPASRPARHPYPGLEAFGPEDAAIFFGRDRAILSIVSRLQQNRCVAIAGDHGIGQTSLLNGGILPAIRSMFPSHAIVGPLTLGEEPYESLTRALDGQGGTGIAILIDRLGEVLGRSAWMRQHFEEHLIQLLKEPSNLLVAVIGPTPEDQLLADLPRLGKRLIENQMSVAPMDAAELRACIVEPSRKAGIRIEPGLPEMIMNDALAAPGSLPVLAFTLRRLAEESGSEIATAAYVRLGGLSGILPKSADITFAALAGPKEYLARRILRSLFRLEAGSAVPQRRTRGFLYHLGRSEEVDAVIARFHEGGVVRISRSGDSLRDDVEITHATLLSEWKTLRDETDRAKEAHRKRLRWQQAGMWAAIAVLVLAVGFTSYSWLSSRQAAASRALAEASLKEPNAERRLVWASEAANIGATPEAGEALASALNYPHASAALLGHTDMATSVTFVNDELFSGGADGHIFRWDLKNTTGRGFAEIHPAADVQIPETDKNPPSKPVILTASSDGKTLGAFRMMEGLYAIAGKATRLPGPEHVTAAAFVSDTAVRGSFEGDVYFGQEKVAGLGHERAVSSIVSMGDGRVVTAGLDGVIKIGGKSGSPEIFEPELGPLYAVAVDDHSDELAAGGISGAITIYSPQSGAPVQTLSGFNGPVRSLAYSRDSAYLAAAVGGATIEVFARNDDGLWEARYALTGPEDNVLSVQFGPNVLAGASADGTIRVWQVPSDFEPADRKFASSRHHREMLGLAYAPDSSVVAAVDRCGQFEFREPATGKLFREGAPLSGSGWAFALGPNEQIAFWGNDRLVVSDWRQAAASAGNNGCTPNPQVASMALAPETHWIAYGRRFTDKATEYLPVVVHNPDTNQTLQLNQNAGDQLKSDAVFDLSFSPDGRSLAVAEGLKIRVWKLQPDGKMWIQQCQGVRHSAQVTGIRFSPDGSRIVSSGMDGMLKLWDSRTCEILHSVGAGFSSGVSGIAVSPEIADGLVRVVAVQGIRPGFVSRFELDSERDHLEALDSYAAGVGMNRAAFSPDGRFLALSTNDGRFIENEIQIPDLAESARKRSRKAIEEDCSRHLLLPRGVCPDMASSWWGSLLPRAEREQWARPDDRVRFRWTAKQVRSASSGVIERPPDYRQIVQAYEQTQLLAPTFPINSFLWNDLCWYASTRAVLENPSDVLEACDAAVALASGDPLVRDARGVARARRATGFREPAARQRWFREAISDFEAFGRAPEGKDYACLRTEWIATLRTGKSPFEISKNLENIAKTDSEAGCLRRQEN